MTRTGLSASSVTRAATAQESNASSRTDWFVTECPPGVVGSFSLVADRDSGRKPAFSLVADRESGRGLVMDATSAASDALTPR